MVRRLCVLCFLVALWPALALAQSAALMDAWDQFFELYVQGRYGEAEPFARKALELAEKEFGSSHPRTAAVLDGLAILYEAQGRYAEAESLYGRSLAISEKALGPDHADVADSLGGLAGLYEAQGRYAEAEPFYRRALAIREKALGPDHPSVADSLNNLATLYEDQAATPRPSRCTSGRWRSGRRRSVPSTLTSP